MRNRINLNATCSSENYEVSKRVHREYIRQFHLENVLLVKQITENTIIKKKCYTLCFGKLMEITEEEATKVETSIKIIRK